MGFRLDASDNSTCNSFSEEEAAAGHVAGRPTWTTGPEAGGCLARCDLYLVQDVQDANLLNVLLSIFFQLSHREEAQDSRGEPRGEDQKPRDSHEVPCACAPFQRLE